MYCFKKKIMLYLFIDYGRVLGGVFMAMQIQQGIVKYKDRNDIICTYGITSDGKQYYFLDSTDSKQLANGNRIATTDLREAVDPMVNDSHVGLLNPDGVEVIPFNNKSIKQVNDNIILVEPSVPLNQSVLDAINLRNDPLSATKLVSNSAAIKDKLNQQIGSEGRYLFNDQFSEATICDINGNNLVNGEMFSFIATANDKLYFSKNTVDTDIVEYSILPPQNVINNQNSIDVSSIQVDQEAVEGALNNNSGTQIEGSNDNVMNSINSDVVVETSTDGFDIPTADESGLIGVPSQVDQSDADVQDSTADQVEDASEDLTSEVADDTIDADVQDSTANQAENVSEDLTSEGANDTADAGVQGGTVDQVEDTSEDLTSEVADDTTDADVQDSTADQVEDASEDLTSEVADDTTDADVQDSTANQAEDVSEDLTSEVTGDVTDADVQDSNQAGDASEDLTSEIAGDTIDADVQDSIADQVEDVNTDFGDNNAVDKMTDANNQADSNSDVVSSDEDNVKVNIFENNDLKNDIEEEQADDLAKAVSNSDSDNIFDSSFEKDFESDIFKDSIVRPDSLVTTEDTFYDFAHGSDFSNSDSIMLDVASSMKKLIQTIKVQDEKLAKYSEQFELANKQLNLMGDRVRKLKAVVSKMTAINKGLERENHELKNTVAQQSKQLNSHSEAKEQVIKLLADTNALLGNDDVSYSYDGSGYGRVA